MILIIFGVYGVSLVFVSGFFSDRCSVLAGRLVLGEDGRWYDGVSLVLVQVFLFDMCVFCRVGWC